MKVSELKEKLHALIKRSSEDTLEYMYSLFEQKEDYSDEFKKLLDEEYTAYQNDRTGDTRKNVNAMIYKLLE